MKPLAELGVTDIMTRTVAVVGLDTSLAEAAARMAELSISSLVIVEDNKPTGLVTEHDVARLILAETPVTTSLRNLTSSTLHTVSSQLDFRSAYSLLRQVGTHHLLVVDEQGGLLGLVSETDMRSHLGVDILNRLGRLDELIEQDIPVVDAGVRLSNAVKLMLYRQAEFVLVVKNNRPVGILTERDLTRLLAQAVDMKAVTVAEKMTTELVTVQKNVPLAEVIDLMREHRIRHLPVLEGDGTLLGILSQNRLLEILGLEMLQEVIQEDDHLRLEKAKIETRLELAMEVGRLGCWEYDHVSGDLRWGESLLQVLGYAEGPPTLESWLEKVHPDERENVHQLIVAGMASGEIHLVHRIRRADGSYAWLETRGKVMNRDSGGLPLFSVGTASDISERQFAQIRIQRLKNFYAAVSHINEAIIHAHDEAELLAQVCRIAVEDGQMRMAWIGKQAKDGDHIVPVSKFGIGTEYLSEIVISTDADVVEGRGPTGTAWREQHPVINNDTHSNVDMSPWRDRALAYGWRSSSCFPVMRQGSIYATFTVYHAETEVFDDEVITLLNRLCADLSFALDNFDREQARLEAQSRIHELAYFDPLTKLANRSLLMDRLGQELSLSMREHRQSGLIVLDIDRFKTLNDARGHSQGDDLLQALAKRLMDILREGDTLARLGGDEFAILLPGLNSHSGVAGHHAAIVAEKIHTGLQEAFQIGDGQIYMSVSLGISLFPESTNDVPDQVLRRADTALQRAKGDGGNRTVFFEAGMSKAAEFYFQIDRELRQAIPANELRLYMQAQFDAAGVMVGAEALVRWQHPERGLVLPALFIPVAEETDLIVDLDIWVFTEVCKFIARQDVRGCPMRIAVNISPRHFRRPNFVGSLKDILKVTGADPSYLTLEVTEGLVIDNISDVITKMTELTTLGIHFSIDDFGTGYSSLAYLKRLPIHEVKIDKSFVQDVTFDDDDAALVEAILAVAKHLNLKVVAEGVETVEQAAFLNSRGTVIHQGYLFSRPEPAEEIAKRFPDAQRSDASRK